MQQVAATVQRKCARKRTFEQGLERKLVAYLEESVVERNALEGTLLLPLSPSLPYRFAPVPRVCRWAGFFPQFILSRRPQRNR